MSHSADISFDPLLDSLTPAQREAATHVDGPQLVLAGPGSGKTRVVTHRLAHLTRLGVPGRQIVALTFTNKAADEMRMRASELAPGEPFWISTFHRFCARLLREHASLVGIDANFTIYDSGDSLSVLKRALEEESIDIRPNTPERLAAAISSAKNRLVPANAYVARRGSTIGPLVAKAYPEYQKRLLVASAVDFDDLLMHVANLLRENPEIRQSLDERFRYILVDEYQDTNLAQYAIVRALSIDYPNLSVTGDPDQAIYGWRGANLGNIIDFENDYPNVKIVRLEQNYRSTKRILSVADGLIAHNARRLPKSLFTDNEHGENVRLVRYPSERDEARDVAEQITSQIRSGKRKAGDFCVLYRINALSRAFESAFCEAGLPYQLVNSLAFYQRREIKDVMAYLNLINNPRDDVALLRSINTPARGIGKTTLKKIAEHAVGRGQTLLEASRECGLIEEVSKRSAVAVAKFVAMFDSLCEFAAAPVEEIIGHVLADSGYGEHVQRSDEDQDEERLANIQELLSAARLFDENYAGDSPLESFLEQASLVNDVDAFESASDRVTLMTIHSAKGLEFPAVYIVAVEQGILPHERSSRDVEQYEEERRLLFVAITRARQSLQFSLARNREFRGQRRIVVPSSFLSELPQDGVELVDRTTGHDPYSPPIEEFDSEVVYRQVEPESPRRASAISLTTAAEMHEESAPRGAAPTPADVFYQGMPVRHPEYGLGKIVALSGAGRRRMATVNFVSQASPKKFMLADSPLRPARDGA